MSEPPYSKVRRARTGALLFVSGQLGWDAAHVLASDVVTQTLRALANIEAALSEHGATRANIVKTTVFLSDLSLWTAMNEPYRAFFGDGPLPARSAVGVQLPEGVLVEIDAVAIADGASSHHGCEVDT